MTHHETHERHEKVPDSAGIEPWKEKIQQHWPKESSGE